MDLAESNNTPAAPARDGWFRFLTIPAAAIIIAAVATAYRNSLDCPFLMDDTPSIIDNASIRSLSSSLLPPSGGATSSGRPLVNLSLAINYSYGKLEVRGYHLFNIGVHIIAALTLMGLIRRTLLLPLMGGRYGWTSLPLAMAAALIWAMHPINTQAVTYIVQRAEAMMAMFCLLMLYFLARSGNSRRPGAWQIAAIVACAAGMMCKESMAAAPIIALLYYATFIRGSWREFFRRDRRLIIALLATLAIVAGMLVMSGMRGGNFAGQSSWWNYTASQPKVIINYLATAFWPTSLIFDYTQPPKSEPAQTAIFTAAIAIMLIATVILVIRKPKIGFLPAAFFLALAPTSSVLPLSEIACEYRMYLPLAAVVTAVVLIPFHLVSRVMKLVEPNARIRILGGMILGVVMTGCLTSVLFMMTRQRNNDYSDPTVLWQDTLEKCPENYRAMMQLGYELIAKGHFEPAMQQLAMAVKIKPDDVDAWNNLGLAYKACQQYDAAMNAFDKAISLRPTFAQAIVNRGNLWYALRNATQAIDDFSAAIALKSDDPTLYFNRGNAYGAIDKLPEAIADYSSAIKINPNFAQPYMARAVCYYYTDQLDKAKADHDMYEKLSKNRMAELDKAIAWKEANTKKPPATSSAPTEK